MSTLRFDATVDRRIVHKGAVEQVLVHDAQRLDERAFACAAQLPRSHSYYSDQLLRIYDPLLLLEVCRQAVVLGSHSYFDVPRGWQFIFSDIRGTVEDVDALRVRAGATECVVALSLEDDRRRQGALSSGRFRADVRIGHATAAMLVGTAAFFSRERYQVLRRAMRRWVRDDTPAEPSAPLAPGAVGRVDPRNVVVAEVPGGDGPYRSRLIVDESHATFFDHPLDHVPGALLIEAFRQTALAAACTRQGRDPARALVVEYEAEYSRLGELGAAIDCTARVTPVHGDGAADRVAVDLALSQCGTTMSEARFVLAFVDG